ncbi:hypothetical protein EUGRSUZ_D00298 [Eucalyptus grandis]|uniref:alpha-1,2-Mannosidase n=2 Tax=Eucalyptus grandis TaxID=71139 RepID=A0A059CC58_EUCGR|nr:hypothetical protein EUGRSUZ_D00298 [Eucalyptus grandis]
MLFGLAYLFLTHTSSGPEVSGGLVKNAMRNEKEKINSDGVSGLKRFWRKPPRLPPRLSPDEKGGKNSFGHEAENPSSRLKWVSRQQKVRDSFIHAWSGYKKYAMGYDELMPLSHHGVDGLGGLGATVVDALDTAIIMGADEIVSEAGSWIETQLLDRIKHKGQVNLFETTIRVLGGLLSAYHLSGGDGGMKLTRNGPKPAVYLDIARDLADRLLSAFTASPTSVPYSDVILRDSSAHPAPGGLSSTSEVSTLQLEFNYLSMVSGDPKYSLEAMKVLEHLKTLPKVEGLVPIYISEAMKGVHNRLVRKSVPNGLVFVGELPYGSNGAFSPKMDHLVCFLPGTLALGATKGKTKEKAMKDNLLTFEDLENLKLAEDLMHTCFQMYSVTSTGLAPEIAYFHTEEYSEEGLDGGNKTSKYLSDIIIKHADRHNLLRPETVESLLFLYRITEDPKYREWGWQIFEAFENYTKVDTGGYSSLDDVTHIPPQRRDKMETFFLGETLKYLYLLFSDSDVIPLDKFIFNTEAHPLPIKGAVRSS